MALQKSLGALYAQLISIDALLHMAGARTWTSAQIKAHKEAELAKAPPPSWFWCHRDGVEVAMSLTILALVFVACLNATIVALSMIMAGLSGALSFFPSLHAQSETLWLAASAIMSGQFLAITLISLVLLFFVTGMADDITLRGPAEWVPYSTNGYRHKYGVMPVEAERIISTVETFGAGYTCRVQVLENNKYKLDPILEIVRNSDGAFRAVYAWE